MTSKLKIDLNVNPDAGLALPSVFRSSYNKVAKCIFFLYGIENIRKSVLRYYVTCTSYEKFLIRKRNLLCSFFPLFRLFLSFSLSHSLSITLPLAASHFSHPLLHHCHTTAPFICEATSELRIAPKRERKEREGERGRERDREYHEMKNGVLHIRCRSTKRKRCWRRDGKREWRW